jgi:hypothetical protein
MQEMNKYIMLCISGMLIGNSKVTSSVRFTNS